MGLVPNFVLSDCNKLCSEDWWLSATEYEKQTKLDALENGNVINESGRTPLHFLSLAPTNLRFRI